jgi:hypothetical protein
MKQFLLLAAFVFGSFTALHATPPPIAVTRYVKTVATGTGDGSSWANASADLQAMINASVSGNAVWVAAGTYLPTRDPFGNAAPTNARDKTFYLKNGVKLYGGFVGTEAATTDRPAFGGSTVTTLSGDIDGNSTLDVGAYESQTDCATAIYTGSSSCQTYTVANVSGNAWFNIYGATGIICSINPNGENLGDLTVTVGDPSGVLTNGAAKFLGRDVDIQSSAYPNGATIPTAYSLRLYFYDAELAAYQTAINSSTTLTPSALNVAWASGGTGCTVSSYVASASSNGLVDKADVAEAEYGMNNNGFYLQLGMAHFTLFAATTSGGTPLPVQLLSFTGYNKGSSNVLVWQTATEQNSNRFEVERTSPDPSKGGRLADFKAIGTLRAAGNSAVSTNYALTDTKPVIGLNYYRLKQIDNDGSFAYSNVISIENKGTGSTMVYPNPVTNVLNISTSDRNQTITVTDAFGRVLYSNTVVPNTIDTNDFAAGVYFVRVGEEVFKVMRE